MQFRIRVFRMLEIIVVSGIANPNLNGNGNVVAVRAEGNAIRNNGDLDEIEEVNANCILMAASIDIGNVISEVSNVEQGGGIVEQHPASVEEARAYFESLYNNLAIKVKKANTINRKLRETNADLTTELLLKEKSTVSSLLEEKKRLKSDFKIREDKLLDKQIQHENKIKESDNILVKTEVDKSLTKHKALELEIERLLRAVVNQDNMSIVQSNYVVDTSNLQTELEGTKERFENCIIKKENEYAKLWNDWYKNVKNANMTKFCTIKLIMTCNKRSNGCKLSWEIHKGKSKDTPCVSDTLDPLSRKLENENVELEFQVLNYAKENAHLKTTYKNLFDSISVTRTQTKTKIDSLQIKLHDMIYENTELRAQLFDKVSEQKDTTKGTSANTKFANQYKTLSCDSVPKIKVHSQAQVDQGSQIKMIQVKEMMQDNDLKNSKSKDKGSKSRSQSMDEQSHYKQDKTITRQSINVKRHIFNVIGGTEEFEERDLNIGGDC
ncbi:hypothetical protein Tco_1465524 [Tanacetum coccineum]